MSPDDIPTEITKLVYSDPSGIALSQNQLAVFLAHYWPDIKAHILREAATQQREVADRLPDHLDAVRPLINRLADLIDPDALVWFAPARVRDAATDLLAATEAARVRLWLIEQALQDIDASQDPAGIVGNVGPYLDGPLHPDWIAAYHAAQES
jgi:hypothetical protein